MKGKMIAVLLAALLAFSALGATAFAQTDGSLTITEPGSYVLTGKLTGCVYVDPGKGEVELVLDGADIDGRTGAGIVAVSGERLTVCLPGLRQPRHGRRTGRELQRRHLQQGAAKLVMNGGEIEAGGRSVAGL